MLIDEKWGCVVNVVPKEFFVTSGKAVAHVSQLNAFDLALIKAGIGQCNLCIVSSILPPGVKQVRRRRIPIGAITHAVIARMDGNEGETIGAGIAWAWEKEGRYGIVAEAHGYMEGRALKEILNWKVTEMAKNRGITLGQIRYQVDILNIPMDHYGTVISALVFIPRP